MNHNTKYIINNSSESGFLALMSAIIISAVLAVVVFSVSFAGFMTRFNILDSEYKARSYAKAEGYASEAFIVLAQDIAGNPNYMTTYGTRPQVAMSATDYYTVEIKNGSQNVTIKSHSVVQRATTNIQIDATYTGGSLTINNWKEIPNI